MKKFKAGLLLMVTFFGAGLLKAQTVEEGRKFLYYERYKSAKSVFEKLVAANPNNVDAVYWLGQSMILPDDNSNVPAAKELYQKTLMANPNSPLLLAGMGQIELLEKKGADAKNRFETAISLTQSKNAPVLYAVGLANVLAPDGDVNYAIDKLKLATSIKNMKDPDVYIALGDAYKKLTDGGNAQKAYESALGLNANYARASYRIGKIYQTQGFAQEEIYMRYYNDAIAKDPAYGPVYENLYQYYYLTNVTKSAEYLEKYLANTDDDPKNCYYRASMKYAQGLFAEAITKADECLGATPEPYPNLYGLKGYAYNKLNDSVNAKASFETYFKKQAAEKIGPTDHKTYAEILLKFPGNDSLAAISMEKAITADSTENGKVALLKSMASYYEAQKNFKAAGDWYSRIVSIRKDTRKTDLFNAGNSYTKAGEYDKSIAVFDNYIQKFPDETFGYYMNAKNFLKRDSTDAESKGFNNYIKIVDMTDAVKGKPGENDRIKGSLRYLIEFYANVKKNKDSALYYTDKAISLDSTDADFKNIREIISKADIKPSKTPASKPASPAKPAANKQAATKTGSNDPAPKKK